MKPKGYMIFHLNLGFSSIDKESWPKVIKNCYMRLLDLVEETNVPIGIELTGWTLKQILSIESSWVNRFKHMIQNKKCELVGSGYCQIIGPLVPYHVNYWNQSLGLIEYKKILDIKPRIALINEMAFSSSMVDLYHRFGFDGIIVDRDNVSLALEIEHLPKSSVPKYAKGVSNVSLPVIWSDSILFQKVQHYAHGDITIDSYLDYVKERNLNGEHVLPIYCNDAEVFDYRPGRFSEERPTHIDGEWNRIKNLIEKLETEVNINWISPTKALSLIQNENEFDTRTLTTASHPIIVKKQAKYNIARWSVTGKDDLWLNTLCHRLAKKMALEHSNDSDAWKQLCELWASDLRTHVTKNKWNEARQLLRENLSRFKISESFSEDPLDCKEFLDLEDVIGTHPGVSIEVDHENIFLTLKTKKIFLMLNLRRGLCVHKLAFKSHDMLPSVGTTPHGFFSSISLGADYYSGGITVELPLERRRITDLESVSPTFFFSKDGSVEIKSKIQSPHGGMQKIIRLSASSEEISISYNFIDWTAINASIRLGNITFLNDFARHGVILRCANGGEKEELFSLDGDVSQHLPASMMVSSSGGFGATTGKIFVEQESNALCLSWEPSECAVMPMLQLRQSAMATLFRIFFSMSEMDDTKKSTSLPLNFKLKISAVNKTNEL